MSAMHRLKAYFGMVPADELDYADYADYPDQRADDRAASYHTEPDRDERYPDGDADAVRRASQPAHGFAAVREGEREGTQVRGALAMEVAAEPAYRGGVPRAAHQRADRQSEARHVTAQHLDTPLGAFAPRDAPHPLARITTLQPRSYNEARTIGERYREGIPVIINLTEMDDAGAKRLVDFAAGLAFALRGSIDKVTSRVFLLSPPDVEVSAADRRRLAEGSFFGQS